MLLFGTTGGLAAKYRPQSLDEVIGQSAAVESLRTMFSRESAMPHCFFFHGPKGCGKTTLAVIVARELGVDDLNFSYLDTATYTGVDDVRKLRQTVQYVGLGGGKKFFLLDEVHRMSKNAQDALLILLENPPKHAYFALCTTERDSVLETVRSRCVSYNLTTLATPDLLDLIKRVEEGEGFSLSMKVKREVVKASSGSCRNCLMILESIKDIDSEDRQMRSIGKADAEEAALRDVIKVLIDSVADNRWARIRSKVEHLQGEPESVRRQVLGYLAKVLVGRDQGEQIAETMAVFSESLFYTGKAGLILQFYLASQIGCE